MSYYDNQESVANIYVGLVERGWKCYGYKADESDSMTDYWSPARWEGIAEKNGFVLLVDVFGTSASGKEITKKGYHVDYAKIEKLKATINDRAASPNEKETAQKIINNMKQKEKESTIVIEKYPTFSHGNPKRNNWHLEKDGEIIAKGNGAFQCDGYLFGGYEKETMEKVNKFIDRVESFMVSNEQLEKVIIKEVKKVIKPVEVTDRKTVQVGDVLSFSYHGHYWQVISVTDKTFTYEILGSEKRGFQRLTNGKRYYDYLTKFEKNLENGSIKLYTLQEVEEVTEKVTYKKTTRKQKAHQENLLQGETTTTEETAQDAKTNEITYQTGTGLKGNGIEITFTEKPSEEVRNALKKAGYRWGGKSRSSIWWAINTEESLSLAELLAGGGDQNDNKSHEEETPEIFEEVAATVEQEETTQEETQNVYNNDIVETPKGFYCHFKAWNNSIEDISYSLNFFGVPYEIAGDKFLFYCLNKKQLETVQALNSANGSILWDDSELYKIDLEFEQREQEQNDNNNYIKFSPEFYETLDQIEKEIDLQFFGSSPAIDDILTAFDEIDLSKGSNSVITDEDRKHCEELEKQFTEFKNIYDALLSQLQHDKVNNIYIDEYRDIKPVKERIEQGKNRFLNDVVNHFKNKYSIDIDYWQLEKKYSNKDITLDEILDEVILLLDGLTFSELEFKQVSESMKDNVKHKDITVKNDKISIGSFFWVTSENWGNLNHKLSYGQYNNVEQLFKVISHFENEDYKQFDQLERTIKHEYNEDVFKVHELNLNKIKSIKLYKNGKIDLMFTSPQNARNFNINYLQQ